MVETNEMSVTKGADEHQTWGDVAPSMDNKKKFQQLPLKRK
jgi:hypothetical protein